MVKVKFKLKERIEQENEYIKTMRQYFHQHPEVSMKEVKTSQKIAEELEAMGIPYKRVGETGIYAWIDGGKAGENKCIALRCDIDALAMDDLKTISYCSKNKGVCHACGHDGHIATLLVVSKVLKELENQFSGQIRLFFQQGEEYGQGARLFVQEGLLNGCHRVFGAHVSSKLYTGQVALTKGPQRASCDYFKITIKGRGAHVSTPHLGIDAAYVAAQVMVALQGIVARSTNPLETVLVGVGVIRAGSQYNVIAENAELEGTTRSFSSHMRKETNDKVVKIAKLVAQTYGAEAEVTFLAYANPVINDDEVVEEVQKVAKKFVNIEDIIIDYEKTMGADDFADFLMETKGMYAFIGTQNEEKENTNLAQHYGLFDIDEDALLISARLHIEYAIDFLENNL